MARPTLKELFQDFQSALEKCEKHYYLGVERWPNRSTLIAIENLLLAGDGCPRTLAKLLLEMHKVSVEAESESLTRQAEREKNRQRQTEELKDEV